MQSIIRQRVGHLPVFDATIICQSVEHLEEKGNAVEALGECRLLAVGLRLDGNLMDLGIEHKVEAKRRLQAEDGVVELHSEFLGVRVLKRLDFRCTYV